VTSQTDRVLIISNSWDATSDALIGKLKDRAFRLNADILSEYEILLSKACSYIASPAEKLDLSLVRQVVWRKPFSVETTVPANASSISTYWIAEAKYVVTEIFNICVSHGANYLIEPYAERRLGKVRQMQVAERYFAVPDWHVMLRNIPRLGGDWVAKSLSSEPVTDESVLYCSSVTLDQIDDSFVWFVQRAVRGSHDVTVVYIKGESFAFELDRRKLPTLDWREQIPNPELMRWRRTRLDPDICSAIAAFMGETELRFGRLDFIRDGDKMWFLEVNPNGQWLWLDLRDNEGVLEAFAQAVS
jgi:hypothetical protein